VDNVTQKAVQPSPFRLAAFASLGLPVAGAFVPLGIYLPPFYAQTMGISLAAVGGIFMFSRLWNAFCDPVVGLLSDRTQTSLGRRKPWILAGTPLFALSVAAIFWPPAHAGAAYLALWLFALYLGWSMIGTPFYAWSGELSAQYHQRSRVQAYMQTVLATGYALVLLLPALLDQFGAHSAHIKVGVMGAFALITLVPGILTIALFFREPPASTTQQKTPPHALADVLRDSLVWRVMGSDFFVSLGQGFRTSLFVFYVSAYMGLPKWASLLYLLQFVFGIAAGPIWLKIGYRLGKHRTVLAGEIAQALINLSLLAIRPGDFTPLLALTIAQGLTQGSGNLMLRSIVADLADRQRLRTGQERSGVLFSLFNVTSNAAGAVAVGVAYPLISWLGFVPGHANTAAALAGVAAVFALGPVLGHSLSALLIWRFPLDEAAQADVRRRLETQEAAVPAIPVTAFGPATDRHPTAHRPFAGPVTQQNPT
jgi:Na+/melibiose symporter-like transporter